MERLAPFEIDQTNLRVGLKGYDKGEVNVLLTRIKNEMTAILTELQTLKEENERQKQIIDTFSSQENSVKDALLVAQRASEEIRNNAHKEADAVIAQSHRGAEETQRQYQAKINDLRWELERTRMERQRFFTEFRNVLEGYLRDLTEDNSPSMPLPNEPSENIKAAIDGTTLS